jgi:tetratricopeptide (TPR) repeat protein
VRNAAKTWPDNFARWEWQVRDLADLLAQQGQSAELDKLYEELSLIRGIASEVRIVFSAAQADVFGRKGKWTEAINCLSEALKSNPKSQFYTLKLAIALAYTGDESRYNELRRKTLDAMADCGDGDIVLPCDAQSLLIVSNWAHISCVSAPPSHSLHVWRQSTMAHVEYRLKHFAEAAERAGKLLLNNDPIGVRRLQTHCILAMAQHRQNRTSEAQATLATAIEISRDDLPDPSSSDLGDTWWDYLLARLLLREATDLLKGHPPGG